MNFKSISIVGTTALILVSCGPNAEKISNSLADNYLKSIEGVKEYDSPVEKAIGLYNLEAQMSDDIDSLRTTAQLEEDIIVEINSLITSAVKTDLEAEKRALFEAQKEVVASLNETDWYSEQGENVLSFDENEIELLNVSSEIPIVFDEENLSVLCDSRPVTFASTEENLQIAIGNQVADLTKATEENFILGSFSGSITFWGEKSYFTLKLNSPDRGVLYAKFANGNRENYKIPKIRSLGGGKYRFTDEENESSTWRYSRDRWKGEIGGTFDLSMRRSRSKEHVALAKAVGIEDRVGPDN